VWTLGRFNNISDILKNSRATDEEMDSLLVRVNGLLGEEYGDLESAVEALINKYEEVMKEAKDDVVEILDMRTERAREVYPFPVRARARFFLFFARACVTVYRRIFDRFLAERAIHAGVKRARMA